MILSNGTLSVNGLISKLLSKVSQVQTTFSMTDLQGVLNLEDQVETIFLQH